MEWEKLVAPLKFGQRGSKILLTTRMDSVADMAAKVMKCKRESLNLNELEESDCMSLFNKHAFLGVNPDGYKNLQLIGEQIVKKLGGCPLAIKVMGGLLNSKDFEYWKRILKEDTMKLQQGKDSIMTVLRLSYDHLPTNLRVCFRYCSIFPQDYEFKRKELVYMWTGSGLISQSICGGQSPEDIGREYLNLLTRKSFFTCKTKDFGHKIYKRYVMHDLMHDLAQSVSLGECIRIRGDVVGNTIPRTVRHLSFETINLHSIEEIPNLKNLRTLVISDKDKHEHNENYLPVFNKVIKGFKNLRLLSLSVNFEYNKLPDAFDSLIHLRYLSISANFASYESFHYQSLYRLYHLVVMKLSFRQIPPMNIEYDGFTNLVNLHSLDVPNDVIENIPYLSKLPFIRKLKDFFVREESGYKISELKNLRDLRGHLSIRRLENVTNSEEVMEAKLKEKEYLKSLSLVWSKRRFNNVKTDEQLLDNLCPHVNLKRLCIEEYQGVKSPYWMTDPSHINLTFIELSDCKGLVHLPPLGGLPSLNGLSMRGLHSVKQIACSFYGCGGGCAFPSLKELYFAEMPNLEEWIGIDDCCMFPKLHSMTITKCPNLKGLPALPRCLNNLQIANVGLTTLPAINKNCGNHNQQEQFSDPKTTLIIKNCEKLQYLPTEFFQKVNTIEVLTIRNCPKLEEWIGIDDGCMFPKLHTMRIYHCPNLRGIPTLPRCLNNLQIEDVGLTTLPAINENCGNHNQQEEFSDHQTLIIEQCEKLQYLPTEFFKKFNTIEVLTIRNCTKLEEWIGIDDCCMFPKLHTMTITRCPNLKGLPALPRCLNKLQIEDVGLTTLPAINENCGNHNQQEQFPALQTLTIHGYEKLQYLPTEFFQKFNTIEDLTIRNCTKLEEWIGIDDGCMFSKLHTMRISDCPNLRGIPTLPQCLNKLQIKDVGLTTLPAINENCGNNNQQEQFSALETLTITECEKLQYLPTEFFKKFNTIKDLNFTNLPNLEWIEIDDCCMFPKLRTMKIINCPNLSGMLTLPCSLTNLYISNMGLTALQAIDENCGNNNQQKQFSAHQTLTIEQCEKLQYLPTEFFQKFNTIKVSGLRAVKKIGSSFFGSSHGWAFPSSEDLYFNDMPNLEEWIGIDDCCMFPKLRTMRINDCPNLSILPTLPCSLRKLHISNVGLTTLPTIDENCGNNNQQDHFQGLEYLTIEQCDKLEYIPTEFFQKFNTVKFLKIEKCPKLTTLGISDIRPPSVLNEIYIGSCGDLEVSFLWSANLTSLTELKLHSCASITSLPPAQVCARWTMLSYLEIVNCKELSSFGGIQALVSLRELEIRGCDKLIEVALRQPPFPNDVGRRNAADCFLKLGKLSIDHRALLLMEPLRSLSSISIFTISDASGLTSLPEEWLLQNHSTLKILYIQNAVSLQSLPQSMTQLCSLVWLEVYDAKLIQSLPDLPTSLHFLRIFGCHPALKERCQENIGLDWPKIANISDVLIYN